MTLFADVWIPDATPIILLGKIGLVSLLMDHGGRVIIPRAVADEINNAGPEDLGRAALVEMSQSKFTHQYAPKPRATVEMFELDAGEAAVLTAALDQIHFHRSVLVVMDEAKGRVGAKMLGLETIGTVGLLIRARDAGKIEALVPYLHALRRVGAWLSPDFCERVAGSVGETWP